MGLFWVFLSLCFGVGVGLFFVLGCFSVCVRIRERFFLSCGMVGYVGLGWGEDEGFHCILFLVALVSQYSLLTRFGKCFITKNF
jgi:hypothetical protein